MALLKAEMSMKYNRERETQEAEPCKTMTMFVKSYKRILPDWEMYVIEAYWYVICDDISWVQKIFVWFQNQILFNQVSRELARRSCAPNGVIKA